MASVLRQASAVWPLGKPPSVVGVLLLADSSAGTTFTSVLQRQGRAYL